MVCAWYVRAAGRMRLHMHGPCTDPPAHTHTLCSPPPRPSAHAPRPHAPRPRPSPSPLAFAPRVQDSLPTLLRLAGAGAERLYSNELDRLSLLLWSAPAPNPPQTPNPPTHPPTHLPSMQTAPRRLTPYAPPPPPPPPRRGAAPTRLVRHGSHHAASARCPSAPPSGFGTRSLPPPFPWPTCCLRCVRHSWRSTRPRTATPPRRVAPPPSPPSPPLPRHAAAAVVVVVRRVWGGRRRRWW